MRDTLEHAANVVNLDIVQVDEPLEDNIAIRDLYASGHTATEDRFPAVLHRTIVN